MGKLKITIHPLFIVFSFILIYFGLINQFFIYLLVLCIHEYSHYFVAKRCGYVLNKMVFMPYGAGIGGESQIINPKHEILIAIAGPLVNLICVVVCVALWWIFPTTFIYTQTFVFASMALGFFNLLPVFPLDGGRVAICYLSNKINKMLVYKIMKYICLFFSLLFLVLFVISIFNSINLTFMFTSVFLFFSCFGTDENVYFERSLVLCNTKQILTPVEVKTFVVNKDVSVYQLAKCVSGNYFTVFKVVDSDNNIIKTITENDLIKILNNHK